MNISAFHLNLKAIILFIGMVVFGTSSVICADQTGNDRDGQEEMPGKKIEEVLKEHTPQLMAPPGVVGTAQGLCDGQPCIKVFAVEKNMGFGREDPR
jgi:hypothetical protein